MQPPGRGHEIQFVEALSDGPVVRKLDCRNARAVGRIGASTGPTLGKDILVLPTAHHAINIGGWRLGTDHHKSDRNGATWSVPRKPAPRAAPESATAEAYPPRLRREVQHMAVKGSGVLGQSQFWVAGAAQTPEQRLWGRRQKRGCSGASDRRPWAPGLGSALVADTASVGQPDPGKSIVPQRS